MLFIFKNPRFLADKGRSGDDRILEESMMKEIGTSLNEPKAETGVNNQLPKKTQDDNTICSVTSKDGTTIGYRHLGHGPALILLHGLMECA